MDYKTQRGFQINLPWETRWRQEDVCVLDQDFLERPNRNMFEKWTYFLVNHPIEILIFQFFLAETKSLQSSFPLKATMKSPIQMTYHPVIKPDFLNTTTVSAFKNENEISPCILSPWISHKWMRKINL